MHIKASTHRLEKLPALEKAAPLKAPGTVTPHSSPMRGGHEAPACTPTQSTRGPREVPEG